MADNKKIFTDLLKELQPTEEFYEENVGEAKKNLKSNEIGYYPKTMVGAYKADLKRVEKAYLRLQDFTFNIEPETVTKSDITRIEKDWDRLETCCSILHSQNAMFTGHIEQRFASVAFTTVKLINGVVQVQQIKEVNKDLVRIMALLKKAKREAAEAEVQLWLNGALTLFSTVVVPQVAAFQTVRMALAVSAASMTIDELLGPKGPSKVSAAKGAATAYAGAEKKFGKAINKVSGTIGTIMGAKADAEEWGEALQTVKKLKKQLKPIQRKLQKLKKGATVGKTMVTLAVSLEKAQKSAENARKKYTTHQKARKRALKELEPAG